MNTPDLEGILFVHPAHEDNQECVEQEEQHHSDYHMDVLHKLLTYVVKHCAEVNSVWWHDEVVEGKQSQMGSFTNCHVRFGFNGHLGKS